MDIKERDKFLTESMGECWHETEPGIPWHCIKCDYYSPEDFISDDGFSTWQGFGKLWARAKKQSWFERFIKDLLGCADRSIPRFAALVCPDDFADDLTRYLIKHPDLDLKIREVDDE